MDAFVSYDGDQDGKEKERSGAGAGGDAQQETDTGAAEGYSAESGKSSMGYVYFIETEDQQFIKIGFSRRPHIRMSEIATLRPTSFALRLVGFVPGNRYVESWLHMIFAEERDNGEWFRNTSRLRMLMDSLELIAPVEFKPVQSRRRPKKVFKPLVVEIDSRREPEPEPEPKADREYTLPALDAWNLKCLRCGYQWL